MTRWCLSPAFVLLLAMSVVPAAFGQTLHVTLLGTGVPTPSAERFQAATLIQAEDMTILVDAGRGVSIRLWQLGIPLSKVDAVFLTHFHSDHINGLADLWATAWLPTQYGRRTTPLYVSGPVGTSEITAGIEQTYARDVAIRAADQNLPLEGAAFDVHEFAANGVVFERRGLVVTAFEVDHGELIKPAYGYRIDYRGRSVLISGDTKYDERIIEAGEGVDLLIHEVLFTDERVFERAPQMLNIRAHHALPDEVGRIFTRVSPKLAVYSHMVMLSLPGIPVPPLGNLIEQTRATYRGPLIIGEDLMRFEVGDSVQVFVGP